MNDKQIGSRLGLLQISNRKCSRHMTSADFAGPKPARNMSIFQI